jgi:hypothetical protein
VRSLIGEVIRIAYQTHAPDGRIVLNLQMVRNRAYESGSAMLQQGKRQEAIQTLAPGEQGSIKPDDPAAMNGNKSTTRNKAKNAASAHRTPHSTRFTGPLAG